MSGSKNDGLAGLVIILFCLFLIVFGFVAKIGQIKQNHEIMENIDDEITRLSAENVEQDKVIDSVQWIEEANLIQDKALISHATRIRELDDKLSNFVMQNEKNVNARVPKDVYYCSSKQVNTSILLNCKQGIKK